MLTFLTGFAASVAHVVTGPDHLAAVTPLSIDSRKESWKIGLSWGLGHTLGMLMIGSLFLFFKNLLPLDQVTRYSDKIIGILLIGIGGWAIFRTWLIHKKVTRTHEHSHTHLFFFSHTHPDPDTSISIHQNSLAALSIGTVHGFAGFSHLFALLPSLALPSVWASVIYILAFACGTILTMILFAFILGRVAFRSVVADKKVFLKWFTLGGGLVAVAIGIIWIIHPI